MNFIDFFARVWPLTDKSREAVSAILRLYRKHGRKASLFTKDADGDRWVTTENKHRVLIGEDGTIKAGFGGKYTGQKIGKIGENSKKNAIERAKSYLSSLREKAVKPVKKSVKKVNAAEKAVRDIINDRIQEKYGKKRVSAEKRAEIIRDYIDEEVRQFENTLGMGESADDNLRSIDACYQLLKESGQIAAHEIQERDNFRAFGGADLTKSMIAEYERQEWEAEQRRRGNRKQSEADTDWILEFV